MQKKLKESKIANQKAITLIALVVTIIVLLILAGITINLVLADGGIFDKAQEAARAQKLAEYKDKIEIAKMAVAISGTNYGKVPIDQLKTELENQGIDVIENGENLEIYIDGIDNPIVIKPTVDENNVEVEYPNLSGSGTGSTSGGTSGGDSSGGTSGDDSGSGGSNSGDNESGGDDVGGGSEETDAVEFEVTADNRSMVGYTGATNEQLVIPSTFTHENTKYVVTSIGTSAFDGCNGLKSVTIPDSVTSIDMMAFFNCTNLTSIDLGKAKTISDYAFVNCTALTSVTIPSSVTSIGDAAFNSCANLTTVKLNDGLKSIGIMAFDSTAIKEITIPSSVTNIEKGAFAKTPIEKVTINDANFTMDETNAYDGIFKNCKSLKNVNLGNKLQRIPINMFSGCTALTSIEFPSNVTTIGAGAFSECGLTSIQIPSNIKTIEEGAFSGNKMTTVNVPATVTSLGGEVFRNCKNLTSITLPSVMTRVPNGLVMECTSLTQVSLPNTITEIWSMAFLGCTSLANLTIPQNVTIIGADAFSGCTSLSSLTIPENVTTIGNGAFESSGIVDITIPSKITSIDMRTFQNATNLKSITIPSGVTAVKARAFYGCSSLTDVYFKGTQTQWNAITPEEDNYPLQNATIHYGS